MRRFALIATLAPVAAFAQPLDGAGIRAALAGRALDYASGASQTFEAGGGTVYIDTRPSRGRWSVRGGRYCSVWPPSERWSCYAVEAIEGGMRFTGPGGDVTDGFYSE